jgi:thiamine biosynthesis lipoprotein
MTAAAAAIEHGTSFACLGGRTAVIASGEYAEALLSVTRSRLERSHRALTRFDRTSELSVLNANPLSHVRVSDVMYRFVDAAADAARRTGGLVDPTLVAEIETAGYRGDLEDFVSLEQSLAAVPGRSPARPHPDARWARVGTDPGGRMVVRPPGVKLDSGGVAKGLLADIAGDSLADCACYVVDCCGDLRLGGSDGIDRTVRVDDPFGRGVLHEFELAEGGVATSGIGRRAWVGPDGRPAHHLLDPSTGRPAYTGIVQATALAPTAAEAEWRAKAALLGGPWTAGEWLGHGGVVVFDDGTHVVLEGRGR